MSFPERRVITLQGHRLVCLVAGDPNNPPILMVHGWAHYPDVWTGTMEAFQNAYYCVAVGVLGLGESDKPPHGDYRITAHGQHVLAIADALGIGRFILFGQSRGGQIALATAAQLAPTRVTKLVDISGVVTGQLTPYMNWIMAPGIWLGAKFAFWYPFLRWCFAHKALATRFYGPYMYDAQNYAPDFAKREILRGLQSSARRTNYLCMRSMRTTNLLPYLKHIQAPTLVIFGKQDGVVPVEQGRLAARHIPQAQLVLIDQCGHYPMYEQWEQYVESLKAFLSQ
jgi:pimeloyl-ACP methyl ester carboxylesterase